MQNKNLFGVKLKQKKTSLERKLVKYDISTFQDRLERLKFLNGVFPKGFSFFSDFETAFVFDETKMAFINGEFIATLTLS
jgi:hypothetical protein